MMASRALTIIIAAVFGGILGLLAAGIWAVDRNPEPKGPLYAVTDESEVLPSLDEPFTGSRFTDLEPVSLSRLPLPLWLVIPVATAGGGAVIGALATGFGVRITRQHQASDRPSD